MQPVARNRCEYSSQNPGVFQNDPRRTSSPGREAGLLLEFADRGDRRVLAGDVHLAGRDLEQCPIERRPVLTDEHHVTVDDGDHADGAGMAGDLAMDHRAVGTAEGGVVDGDDDTVVDEGLVEGFEAGHEPVTADRPASGRDR